MKSSHLLSTVAATLLLGTGATLAQSTQTPERAPSAQQQAPAEKTGPSINEKKAPETTGQSSTDSKSGASPDSKSGASSSPSMKTDEKAGDSKSSATSGQAPSSSDSKAKGATDANKATSGDSTQSAPSTNRSAAPTANQSAAPAANPSASSGTTTGQGPAGAVKLSTEQQTRITSVIKKQDVKPVSASQLNVSISVGTKVPNTVHLYPLPAEVITMYPEWRGYYYILVGDQIVIIQPTTHEIVYIISV